VTDNHYGTPFVETEIILAAQEAVEEGGPAIDYLRECIASLLPGERMLLQRAAGRISFELDRMGT
jgi:hypothetical protein